MDYRKRGQGFILMSFGGVLGIAALMSPSFLSGDGNSVFGILILMAFNGLIAYGLIRWGLHMWRTSAGDFEASKSPMNPQGQMELGLKYLDGDGVTKDPQEALRLLTLAAESGNFEAQFFVGRMYTGELGIEPDINLAVHWYRKSAEQGHPYAQHSMGQICYTAGRNYLSYVWCSLAVQSGEPEAATSLQWASDQLTDEERAYAEQDVALIRVGKAASSRFVGAE